MWCSIIIFHSLQNVARALPYSISYLPFSSSFRFLFSSLGCVYECVFFSSFYPPIRCVCRFVFSFFLLLLCFFTISSERSFTFPIFCIFEVLTLNEFCFSGKKFSFASLTYSFCAISFFDRVNRTTDKRTNNRQNDIIHMMRTQNHPHSHVIQVVDSKSVSLSFLIWNLKASRAKMSFTNVLSVYSLSSLPCDLRKFSRTPNCFILFQDKV